ncbi:MurR/RpiR family transcriptional regulator [Crossiella cryophila]|uniref:DNA-binding MurR/RpiR family transcriptional regulator n=1 Tax=Crossiella cryophila TaxID=43355 RepID=A0A7W7CEP4_9PSEU|nr:MurR/RpiR family transcriptional regulator [Crossiella cryophila]MBB4678526.1 DNA-binding MurR/RpiR family transcriptional regulator [Crossiella cryophila]
MDSTGLRQLLGGRRLSPAQRRIARYLLDHPHEAAFLGTVDLAERVGVSQASVTRFAFALGFDAFPEFRAALRDLVLTQPAKPAPTEALNEIQLLLDTEIRNLHTLRDSLSDLGPLHQAAAALAASRPLPVIGQRVSAPLAHLFGYFAAKVHLDVRVLDIPGSLLEDGLTRAVDAGATCVLAFALPRYPRETLSALTWAKQVGLTTVLVTDQPITPLTDHADLVLTAPVSSQFAFDSHAASTALCAALLHAMLAALPPEQQASLEAFEQSAAQREVFLAD